jgi:hypothetical protein
MGGELPFISSISIHNPYTVRTRNNIASPSGVQDGVLAFVASATMVLPVPFGLIVQISLLAGRLFCLFWVTKQGT